MAARSNQMKWIVALGAAGLLVFLVYSSWQATHKRYEVCVNFRGDTHCSLASGATSEDAIRSAQGIDCQLVTNGRDELMVCMDTPPASVRQVK
ncbi:MAG: hypothetical protein ACRD5R_11055 [Candidatus Acidiferrales bacterium]